jgi:hypothetical protein
LAAGNDIKHAVAGLHRATLELDVAVDDARHRDRRVRTQQFLHGGGPQVGVVAQLLAVLRVLGEVPQRGTDRRPGGVDTGDEHQVAHTHHVLHGHLLPIDLGVAAAW